MTAIANPMRGEIGLRIAGTDHVLRPSFQALVAAETEFGSLFALVERAAGGGLSIAEMAGLIWHCLPAEARPDRDCIGDELLAIGLIEATRPVRAIFNQVLKGQS